MIISRLFLGSNGEASVTVSRVAVRVGTRVGTSYVGSGLGGIILEVVSARGCSNP